MRDHAGTVGGVIRAGVSLTRTRLGMVLLGMVLLAASGCAAVAEGQAVLSGPAPTTTAPPPPPRSVVEQQWTPFATIGDLTLTHPAARVERVAFHQANHDGTRTFDPVPGAVAPTVLDSRQRDTGPRTAADVVVDPTSEIRSPVSGTVVWSGTYVLYCKHSDDYVVINPDQHPGWQVKILHIDGVTVGPGDRVTAGVTVIAPRATQLPVPSQVDKLRTAEPAWPHVHIEVVDPTIPDRPNGPGCP